MSWSRAYERYSEAAQSKEVEVLSVDIFDTLLLRTTLPESVKFLRFGESMKSLFPGTLSGVKDQARYLRTLRQLAAHTIYHQKVMVRGGREAKLDEIYAYMLHALRYHLELSDLDSARLLADIRRVELDIESLDLTPNVMLVETLKRASCAGKKIIGISDMYLSLEDIDWLLRRSRLDGLLDSLYVSSEYGYGKGAGTLFEDAIREADRLPSQICHIGDNHYSDYVMPLSKGIRAIHAPRSIGWRVIRRARQYLDV